MSLVLSQISDPVERLSQIRRLMLGQAHTLSAAGLSKPSETLRFLGSEMQRTIDDLSVKEAAQ